jgi:GH15 family glucan-1,4-alpha-glucosidase
MPLQSSHEHRAIKKCHHRHKTPQIDIKLIHRVKIFIPHLAMPTTNTRDAHEENNAKRPKTVRIRDGETTSNTEMLYRHYSSQVHKGPYASSELLDASAKVMKEHHSQPVL